MDRKQAIERISQMAEEIGEDNPDSGLVTLRGVLLIVGGAIKRGDAIFDAFANYCAIFATQQIENEKATVPGNKSVQ